MKTRLNRSFSKTELLIILALTLLLLFLLYYKFIYLDINEQKDSFDTASIEMEMQAEQAKAVRKKRMLDEIDAARGLVSTSELAFYDNQKAEIKLLNDIFKPVIRYNFNFDKPVATGDTVRRAVQVSFTAIDYLSALDIIKQLYDSKYRVLIRDITVTPDMLTSKYLKEKEKETETEAQAVMPGADGMTAPDGTVTGEDSAASDGAALPEDIIASADGTAAGETAPAEGAGTAAAGNSAAGAEGTAGVQQETTGETDPITGEPIYIPLAAPQIAQPETKAPETEEPPHTLENSLINVNLTMTFYETIYGVENLDGLIIKDTSETNTSE